MGLGKQSPRYVTGEPMKCSLLLRGVLAVLFLSGFAPPAHAGFFMVNDQKVDVPFPVVHTLFNFSAAQTAANAHEKVCKIKERKRGFACKHEYWFGVLENPQALRPFYLARRDVSAIRQVVLHATITRGVSPAVRSLVVGGRSTHLLIDSDGTVYQLADLAHTSYHMGDGFDSTSIGVDLVSPLNNLKMPMGQQRDKKTKNLWPRPYLEKLGLKRPVARFTLRGLALAARGPTSAQQTSLTAVCKALVRAFPTIQRRVPRDGEGKVLFDTLDEKAHFSGIMGHYHVSPNRWDPGPGIDWEALEKAIQ